jgi:hypothetical protein
MVQLRIMGQAHILDRVRTVGRLRTMDQVRITGSLPILDRVRTMGRLRSMHGPLNRPMGNISRQRSLKGLLKAATKEHNMSLGIWYSLWTWLTCQTRTEGLKDGQSNFVRSVGK